MFGYMNALKDELRVRELKLYKGYYCGICKSIGDRYGQIPRMVLSYDAVLLALILSALEDGSEELSEEHCILHHIKKNPVVRNSSAIDYSADMMLISAYHKFNDDIYDENSLRGRTMKVILSTAYQKLNEKYPQICVEVEEALKSLHILEKQKSASLDLTAAASATALKPIFTSYFSDEIVNKVLKEIAENLGKWVYIIDALDDFDDDRKKGLYNPLIYRHNRMEGLEELLYGYLAMGSSALDLLELKKNESMIRNILMLGMRARTDSLLSEKIENGEFDEGSL